MNGLSDEEKKKIKYHSKKCYSSYIRKGERKNEPALDVNPEVGPEMQCLEIDVTDQAPRTRSASMTSPEGKTLVSPLGQQSCIICQQAKSKGVSKLFRISEYKSAASFVVHTRCVFFQSVGDIFAADIMYHNGCMRAYIRDFERSLEKIDQIRHEVDEDSSAVIDEFCSTLMLATEGYLLSDCRDEINKKLDSKGKSITITNRQLKEFLIKKYGYDIGFSSSYRKNESEMFFSTNISKNELVKNK